MYIIIIFIFDIWQQFSFLCVEYSKKYYSNYFENIFIDLYIILYIIFINV